MSVPTPTRAAHSSTAAATNCDALRHEHDDGGHDPVANMGGDRREEHEQQHAVGDRETERMSAGEAGTRRGRHHDIHDRAESSDKGLHTGVEDGCAQPGHRDVCGEPRRTAQQQPHGDNRDHHPRHLGTAEMGEETESGSHPRAVTDDGVDHIAIASVDVAQQRCPRRDEREDDCEQDARDDHSAETQEASHHELRRFLRSLMLVR